MERDHFRFLISPNLAGWGPALLRRGYISAGYAGNDGMDDAAALAQLYPDYDFALLPASAAWAAGASRGLPGNSAASGSKSASACSDTRAMAKMAGDRHGVGRAHLRRNRWQ